jgi:hypothetical protein
MLSSALDQDRVGALEVRRLTKQATFFLVLWLFGIGSVVAIVNGVRAHALIGSSDGRIKGSVAAWVCIVLGLAEIALAIKFVATGRF